MRRSALALFFAVALALPAHAEGPRTQSSLALIAPTPATLDNGDRIATTAWVNNFVNAGLPLASGKIWIGSGSNIATAVTPSGDCTISIPGVITCTQSAGNFNVIGNLTVGGSIIDGNGILFTNIAAPATPAAGTTRGYVDSTNKVLSAKNDAGTVSNTVVPSTAGANAFATAVSAAGVITYSPIAANSITRAMEAQGVARSVVGVTGNATANVADIQGTANQFLGVNSAGTALAFNTMSQDCTLATGVITCTKSNGASFGGAAFVNTGTSGATIPLLNAANAWSATQSFSNATFSALFTGGPVGFGTATPNSKVHAAQDLTSDPTTGVYGQVEATGGSNLNQRMALAYNTTGDYGTLQAVLNGTNFKDIAINPRGGHVRTGSTAPALTSCGTSPSIVGSDTAGTVTMGTGTPTGCILTFNIAYIAAPHCVVSWQSNLASMQYVSAASTLTLTQTATSSNVVNYHCIARSGG